MCYFNGYIINWWVWVDVIGYGYKIGSGYIRSYCWVGYLVYYYIGFCCLYVGVGRIVVVFDLYVFIGINVVIINDIEVWSSKV